MTEDWPPPRIPAIPEQLLHAAHEATLTLFLGAGVSRLLGSPSWADLAQLVLKDLATKRAITFAEVDQLLALQDPRKQLTIARQIANSESLEIDFDSMIHKANHENSRAYEHIREIGCTCVTTNYDRFVDGLPLATDAISSEPAKTAQHPTPRTICRPQQLTISLLRQPGTVVHLHGSVEDPHSMVLTTSDYLKHYENKRVKGFLEELFAQYTVLFVGYGLQELEVLEYILRKGEIEKGHQETRYMLWGCFSHQKHTYYHLDRYYREVFGVRLVPFSRDDRDYHQLEKILEDWSPKLRVGPPTLTDDLHIILRATDE